MFYIILSVVLIAVFIFICSLRVVVPTNETHIVQRRGKTFSYGNVSNSSGNSYYAFPECLPILGISRTIYPISVFDIDLQGYEAYDKGRLPFVTDIKAFFRIEESALAASRVSSFQELREQLTGIVQGAVRSILAKEELEEIMSDRSKYGELFTTEVSDQLKEWGVTPVKNIELMDIRDNRDTRVIQNIMAKKKSLIEKESRVEVAKNLQEAQEAEIQAEQVVLTKKEEARCQVGLKQADVDKEVGLRNADTKKAIQEREKLVAEKEMEVLKVKAVQRSEIEKQAKIIDAQKEKEVVTLAAEANKQQMFLKAEADLEVATKGSKAIALEGEAKAKAEALMQKASVESQISLAKEIGENSGYQEYLIRIEQVKAQQEVGIEQARNLGHSDIKIICNSGDINSGVSKVMDLFTPKGGTNVAGALEALSQTDFGKKLVDKFVSKKEFPKIDISEKENKNKKVLKEKTSKEEMNIKELD